MNKRKILPLILSLFLFSSLAMSALTLPGLEPDDNWKTSDKTPKFCVRPVSGTTSETLNVTLYINDTAFGEKISASNNTKMCLSTNASLNYDEYTWKFGATDAVAGLEVNSTARTITISRFGSVTQTVTDTVGIFAPIVSIVVAVVPVIIVIAIIGFILALLTGLLGDIEGKVKKGI